MHWSEYFSVLLEQSSFSRDIHTELLAAGLPNSNRFFYIRLDHRTQKTGHCCDAGVLPSFEEQAITNPAQT